MSTSIPAPNIGSKPSWTLADRLRKAREAAGLEQGQLSSVANIARTTISNAENGRSTPSRATIALWAMATGVSRTWLQTGEDSDSLDVVRMNALMAIMTAGRTPNALGHEDADSVLEAVAQREREVQDSGRWQASSAIHHPEVLDWCMKYRRDLAGALVAAGENAESPRPDGPDGGLTSRLRESNPRPIHYE